MECPYIRIEETGGVTQLTGEVTTVGRGQYVDVQLADPSVSMLHAELIRRGPYVYVTDLGLSRNGTRVNGRLVARRLLADGDVVTFGSARCRIGGVACEELSADSDLRRPATPELTRRELDVVTSLCRPALSDEAFVAPAAAREIAVDLVVTEAAVKQHLLRLYQKLRIAEGPNRRIRLANEVVALGLVRPLPQAMVPGPASSAAPASSPAAPAAPASAVPPQAGPPPAEAAAGTGAAVSPATSSAG
jgi:FHA domain